MVNRVVVTGMGAMTPIGLGLDNFIEALWAGKSGADVLNLKSPETTEFLEAKIACQITDFDPKNYMSVPNINRTDLCTQYGVAATVDAFSNSGLVDDTGKLVYIDPWSIGAYLGTGIGGWDTIQVETRGMINGERDEKTRKEKLIASYTVPKLMHNAPAGQIAIQWGLKGNSFTIGSACSSASTAMGLAYSDIASGQHQIIVTGGTEAAISQLTVDSFGCMGALTTEYNDNPKAASRPFDKDRSGFVIGEGAGILIMENYEHAKARGAKMYAEVLGYGATNDGYNLFKPHPKSEGAIVALKKSLKMAKIDPSEVDYINAHGTSTPLNGPAETRAIREVFGKHADEIYVSSTKSLIGHLLGASGAVGSIASIKGMDEGIIHHNANYETHDPECNLRIVRDEPLKKEHNTIISNSLGFGGHNVCLIFRKVV